VTHRFGQFEFDTESGELRRQGRGVRLEPQPARALGLLLARAGDIVPRDEMRAHLWDAGTHVDFDRGLAYCIGQVRTALGDSAENPRFVETLPKRGYRFIAPVEPIAAEPADLPSTPLELVPPPASRRTWWPVVGLIVLVGLAVIWTGRQGMTNPRPIVAVAVFDNESGSPSLDPLARTAADVMVDRLTAMGLGNLGVVGNTPSLRTVRAQRDPAKVKTETGAGYLVFGQVQPDEEGVRLVVHLIRLDDNTHLWVTRVARPLSSLAGIEQVVADRLADAVRLHVIERDPAAPRFTR